MLTIRLSRVGKKKYATYRIIIQEKARDPWAKALEILGTYNPHTKEIKYKQERLNYWLSVGAQTSATVNNLLIKNNIIEGSKRKAAKLNKKKEQTEKQSSEANKTGEENQAKADEDKVAERQEELKQKKDESAEDKDDEQEKNNKLKQEATQDNQPKQETDKDKKDTSDKE